MALKLASVLSARRAVRLNSLSLPKKFSIRRRHLYLGAPFVEIGDTKTERICHGLRVVGSKTPAFALLSFPQYPMQRYKTFIFPVRQ
jgi:hypothetical protein